MRRLIVMKILAATVAAATAFLAGCGRRSSSGSMSNNMHSMMGSGSNGGMMNGGMMGGEMMNVSQHDMSIYMEMFSHHTDIRRNVERVASGIRTTTESDNPGIVQLLHEHVPSMYRHVNDGDEVRCMSDSLPTMFRNHDKYHRTLRLTAKGVVAVEISDDPVVLAAILRHADEVSGFVHEGMPAMMRGMMR